MSEICTIERRESLQYSMAAFTQPSMRNQRKPLFLDRAAMVLGCKPCDIRRPKGWDASAKRDSQASKRRQACALVMREAMNLPISRIALALGVHNDSVYFGISAAKKRLENDPDFANMVDALEMAV